MLPNEVIRVWPPNPHKMDFFAAAKDAMNAASEQASQRVAQAQAGKRLLDDGGPEMEQKIATKAHCRRTTNATAPARIVVRPAINNPVTGTSQLGDI